MMDGMPQPIYLDHNASTPVLPEVVEAMRACWAEPYVNPASQHEFGRRARRVLEDAREKIGELLGAAAGDRVVFTSSGTESNNLAVRGLLVRTGITYIGSPPPGSTTAHLIISAAEHASITALVSELQRCGHEFDILPLSSHGTLRTDRLRDFLRPDTTLVAAILGHNETGVLQPVANLVTKCDQIGIPVHTDASQVVGKVAVNFRSLGVATMTVAGHKFGGPVGVGALVVREHVELQPQLFGGFQQGGTRPSTESVALAVGLCRAVELWEANRSEWAGRIAALRDYFEDVLCQNIGRDSAAASTPGRPVVIAADAARLPNTSNIAFIGLDRQQLFIALDQAGVSCSAGAACASGSSEPSPVHVAMGCEPAVISSALRFSFGVSTTRAEVEEAARRIINVCNALGRRKDS
jgi:cysteine desulfurase